MATYVVLISLFLLEAAVGDKLLRPTKKCVPTFTIVGACHVCVCSIDGIYQCHEQICRQDLLKASDPRLLECEPKELYRENTTFCSCAASGHWLTDNCRERFHRLIPKKDPIKKYLRTTIACKPSALYITDCNVCICKASGVIDFDSCTSRLCPKRLKGDYCSPGDVFRSANEFCICSFVNYFLDRLCLKILDEVVEPVRPKDLAQIINIGSHFIIHKNECEDSVLLKIDCNTCICQKNQYVCTHKICHDAKASLRIAAKSKKAGMLELNTEDDKCIPGKKYKLKCNTCVCNRKGSPICTSMICLLDLAVDAAALREMIISH